MATHLVGITNGRIEHTIRRAATWDAWDDVMNSAGNLPDPPLEVACGVVGGVLHVCALTANSLFHTTRTGRGAWAGWVDIGSKRFPEVGEFAHMDCVGIGSELHVCVLGKRKNKSGLDQFFNVFHALRSGPTTWSTVVQGYTNYIATWADIACASVNDGELHVLTRGQQLLTGKEVLMHNIRFPSGNWQGDADVIAGYPNRTTLQGTKNIAGAGIGASLHVLASTGQDLFHTIRVNNTTWQAGFPDVRPAIAGGAFTAALELPACASDGGNLQICAISNGTIEHVIRLTNPPAFANPESRQGGNWGDVLRDGPPPNEGVPRKFRSIACAGA